MSPSPASIEDDGCHCFCSSSSANPFPYAAACRYLFCFPTSQAPRAERRQAWMAPCKGLLFPPPPLLLDKEGEEKCDGEEGIPDVIAPPPFAGPVPPGVGGDAKMARMFSSA